jgi:hypothetical protein
LFDIFGISRGGHNEGIGTIEPLLSIPSIFRAIGCADALGIVAAVALQVELSFQRLVHRFDDFAEWSQEPNEWPFGLLGPDLGSDQGELRGVGVGPLAR